jgi:competence protein ComEA
LGLIGLFWKASLMGSQAQKAYLLGMIILATTLIAVTAYLFLHEPPTTTVRILPPLPIATDLPTPTQAPLEIYVTGAVQQPETRLSLPPGSRVEDAIQAAGGVADDANLSAVNLAQLLRDGDLVHVPSTSEASTTGQAPAPVPTSNQPLLVNLNTATLEELDELPGVGEATARAIIDYRDTNGPFTTVEDLLKVSGIGQRTLDNLRPFITVE